MGLNLFTSVAGQRLFDDNWSRYQSGYKRWPIQAIYPLLLGLLHVVSLVESCEIHHARFLHDPEMFPISCGLFQYSFPFPNLIAHVFPTCQNFFYCPSQGDLGASPAMNPHCYLVSLDMWVVTLSSGMFYQVQICCICLCCGKLLPVYKYVCYVSAVFVNDVKRCYICFFLHWFNYIKMLLFHLACLDLIKSWMHQLCRRRIGGTDRQRE